MCNCNKITICTEFDAAQIAGLQVPIASIHAFATQTVPADYLICDGSAVSRAEYAELFAALGTVWGEGDGSTTFNIPDLRGEFLRGFDAGRSVDGARVFGTAQLDQLQGHSHDFSVAAHFPTVGFSVQGLRDGDATQQTTVNNVGMVSSDGVNSTPRIGQETRPRNVAVTYAIKATVPAAA
ncbi:MULTISPECIES: phage tail protein [Thalassospira]|uniref:Phage tail collar domain-containing protein n=1 Tax=Thalassospira profundimaris TaxID=502049 RepID=A0A367V8J5_9PROT|nr:MULTISPECIES: phage tail protein [Thalassospira]KZB72341.1 hypothetical protein AUQ43_04310 [Thalassospira sp. MCCC 1A01148]RCK21548.1 hypothetical protein TH6_13190 [Thalassospira profundimaris]